MAGEKGVLGSSGGCGGKRSAGIGAVELLRERSPPPRRVGVGTGSTVREFLSELSSEEWAADAVYYPSSRDSAMLLAELGFTVGHPGSVASLDVYVDGADEVDPYGRLVKGRGAALLGEKMLAYRSHYNIIIVDESKLVNVLGSRKPVPIEVVPDALPHVLVELESRGLHPRVRRGSGKDGPVVSDWGGVIVDLTIPSGVNVEELDSMLHSIPGIVETGIFIGLTDAVVVGYEGCKWKVERYQRRRGILARA